MTQIRILPEILSNKIAAGEVVERPASVVKELVENAMDAESRRIIIEVENGGRSLIRVSDNGTGMAPDDALLSIERYATSKIVSDDDLFAIRTLGFRGEALPSIASVSKFTLETRRADAEAGTRIDIEGGTLKNVSEVGAPVGTQVTVRRLFFNTPARRKFMKAVGTEMGHIGDAVAGMALAWPEVQFRLIHNGKTVKNWSATTSPESRAAEALGCDPRAELCPVGATAEAVSLSGWIGMPHINRATSRSIYIYVNGRFVKDRMARHALISGYEGRLMKGRFPVAVLFIEAPPDQVDVNVHPTKSEVRFARHRDVHTAISRAVAHALRSAEISRWNLPEPTPSEPFSSEPPDDQSVPSRDAVPERLPGRCPGEAGRGGIVAERTLPFSEDEPSLFRDLGSRQPGVNAPLPPSDRFRPDFSPKTTPLYDNPSADMPRPSKTPPDERPATPTPEQPGLWQSNRFADLRVIGQFQGTYILCESEAGLVLIDQHAAHERIVYERLRTKADGGRPAAQRLLTPETIELSFSEAELVGRLRSHFDRLGIEIEPFGGNTFLIKSAPALLSGRPVRPLVFEILERMAEVGIRTEGDAITDEFLKLMACHSAIRAHHSLSDAEIKALLREMDRCENPSNCPHGRPTWLRWTSRFLEKSFRRII